MCKIRFQLRTSDEILNRVETLSAISGESKNSVFNVLLAVQLGGIQSDVTSKKGQSESNTEEAKESSVVHDNEDEKSSDECDVTSEIKNKRVSSPPTTPSPSQKKKGILRIPKKEKVSSPIGHGRKPKDFAQCLEYFKYRRIPNPEQKAREFYDFYDAKGWVVGKNPIKKWSCCLTTWISNNPGWEPSEEAETEGISLQKVLGWMEKEHAEWFEKFKNAKNLGEIDGFYIDEYRNT